MNFQKFQLKWKIWKHFTNPKQRSAWRKLSSAPTDKSFLRFWNKNFQTEIYGNIQKLLSECSNNAGLGRLEWCFFWHQAETCCWLSCRNIFFIMLSELRFIKWVRVLSETVLYNEWSFFLVFVGFETFYQKIWN